MGLLGQVELNFGAEPGCRTRVRVRHQRLVYVSIQIQLNVQFLIDHIADVGPQLEVDVAIGNGVGLGNFALYGLAVGNTYVQSECNIVL